MTVVIAFGVSGAAGTAAGPSATSRAQVLESRAPAPEKCLSARKAVVYYRAHTHERQSARGGALADRTPLVRGRSCHWARYAARVWIARSRAAAKALVRWEYEFAWWQWMPDKWQRIGACETGYGKRPGNFQHSNSSYEGFAGFAKSSWDAFKGRADAKAGPYPEDAWQATPRQQYEVALAIWRAYGFSGWGCRNA